MIVCWRKTCAHTQEAMPCHRKNYVNGKVFCQNHSFWVYTNYPIRKLKFINGIIEQMKIYSAQTKPIPFVYFKTAQLGLRCTQ